MRKMGLFIAFAILLSLIASATFTNGPTPPWMGCEKVCDAGRASGDSCIDPEERQHQPQGKACNSWESYPSKVFEYWIEDSGRQGSIFSIIWDEVRRNLVSVIFVLGFGWSTSIFATLNREKENSIELAQEANNIQKANADFRSALKPFHLKATNMLRRPATRITDNDYSSLKIGLEGLERLATDTNEDDQFQKYSTQLDNLVSKSVRARGKGAGVYDDYDEVNDLFSGIMSGALSMREAQKAQAFNIRTGSDLSYGAW